jgi:hypothetical protein
MHMLVNRGNVELSHIAKAQTNTTAATVSPIANNENEPRQTEAGVEKTTSSVSFIS